MLQSLRPLLTKILNPVAKNLNINPNIVTVISPFIAVIAAYGFANKMLILAETDGVPSYANMEKDEAKWLFVAPWTGDFPFNEAYGNTDAFWKTFMTDQGIITRDQVTVKK